MNATVLARCLSKYFMEGEIFQTNISLAWSKIIQRLIHRQFPEHHHLRNAQQRLANRPLHQRGHIPQHHRRRTQRFTGVRQQFLGGDFGVGEEHGVGCVGRGHNLAGGVQVVVEGAFGGFAEFSGIGGFVGGDRFGFGWVRCDFEHDETPGKAIKEPSRFATKRRVAAMHRLVDRPRSPARPKTPYA